VASPLSLIKKTIRYPALYASALAARRHFREPRTLDEAFAFTHQYKWKGGSLRAIQARDEIVWLLELVKALAPKRVLEIGTANGGTLFLWTRVAAPDAHLVTVDVCPMGLLGRYAAFAVLCRGFARAAQRIDLIYGVDSHDPATLEEVKRVIGNEPVDFLFIDADHAYESVSRDFELYSTLVRPGGLIAFHDVEPRSVNSGGVPKFWSEFKATRQTVSRLSPTEPSYGIGVWRVPEAS
jgi:predicted O-methyltransferase YrrM